MATIRKRSWSTPSGDCKTAWQVSYTDGQGKRRAKQFETKKAADAWLTQARHEVARGVHTADSASITVAQASATWLADREANGVEAATYRAYESTARLHIIPLIGAEKLSRLSKPGVEKFKDDLLATGRSRARAGRALRFLSMMIEEAERRGFVAQNVAKNVKVIRSSRDKAGVTIPTAAELKLMLKHASPEFRPLVMVAMLTGLRASELRGLTWAAVDLAKATVRVDQRADEQNNMGSPKSKAGRRSVPLSPGLVRELRAWKVRCRPSALKLVFPSPEGSIWSYANLMNRAFWPMQVAAGVTVPQLDKSGAPVLDDDRNEVPDAKYSLHALRHAAASLWIRQGIDLKRLTSWMGHASVQTTIDTYGHLMFDEVGDAALVASAETALLG